MKTLAWIWLFIVTLLSAWFLLTAWHGLSIDSDIFALLPKDEQDQDLERALKSQSQEFARSMLFLVSHREQGQLLADVKTLSEKLKASEAFESVSSSEEFKIEEAQEFFGVHAPLLAATSLVETYRDKAKFKNFLKDTEGLLYSPLSSFYARFIKQDPLLLAPRFLQGLPKPPGSIVDGVLIVRSKTGEDFGVIYALAHENQFAIKGGTQLVGTINKIIEEINESSPLSEVRYTGVARFSASSASQMEAELSMITIVSVVAICLILLLMFRSIWILGAGFLPLVVGTVVAAAGTYLIFPNVHILTFVFGSSLLGVGVDYSFQYLTQHRAKVGTAFEIVKSIFPGVTLGVLTTIFAYIALGYPPFPGLRQMAVFSALGVTAAYVTVMLWFPFILRKPGRSEITFSSGISKALKKLPLYSLPCLGIAAGIFWLKPNDDIRLLQQVQPELLEETKFISETMGSFDPSRFFVVHGKSEDGVLESLESMKSSLQSLVQQGAIDSYLLLSDFLPSQKTQSQSLEWVKELYASSEFKGYLKSIGYIGPTALETMHLLSVKDYRDGSFSKLFSSFWLGGVGDHHVALVPLTNVKNEKLLEEAFPAQTNIQYVNKVNTYASLFEHYRKATTYMVGGAYLLIFMLLIPRYGLRGAVMVLLPPLFAAGCALGALGIFSHYYNLFSILALCLVLGIGIDYSIFLIEAQRIGPTFVAVQLSALTTILSFGLLAFSSNPILYNIGLTVCVGIIVSFLFSPLALWFPKKRSI